MIHVTKIIYIHDKDCKDERVKRQGDIFYHSVEVSLSFYSKEELEEWRAKLKEVTGFSKIDFRYVEGQKSTTEDTPIHSDVTYLAEGREVSLTQ